MISMLRPWKSLIDSFQNIKQASPRGDACLMSSCMSFNSSVTVLLFFLPVAYLRLIGWRITVLQFSGATLRASER